MIGSLKAFSEGWRFHIRGVRFGFGHLSFLSLSLLPFVVSLALYIFAFYMFTLHAEDLLAMIWRPEAGQSSRYVGWLYWAYTHVVKFFLYFIVLVVMFYTFILISNILASPVYDFFSAKYEKNFVKARLTGEGLASGKGVLAIIREEIKKALLMLVVPLPFIFIPVVGAVLGFILASAFIAWDYIDFSLARDSPLLRDRIRTVWRFKFMFLGFGSPLLIPFFGLFVMPFAILGATQLYFEKIRQLPASEGPSEAG